ncbi:hypothetical protein DTO164E3_640 [Paecilomyces variotii]|nr:hypothetical protein DTO164E3_640 [Paecilomyces variotii]
MVDLGPFHILSYGTLLGVEVFQSFIGGIVSFRVLPRPQFSLLQSHIFPIYFSLQTALPVVAALTYPGEKTLLGNGPSSLAGVLAPENRLSTLLPLATVFITGLTNLAFLGPQTVNIMEERKKQEAIDGKKSYDPAPHSKEMLALNKRFGKLHGYSTLVNLAAILATISYGYVLGKRIY